MIIGTGFQKKHTQNWDICIRKKIAGGRDLLTIMLFLNIGLPNMFCKEFEF